MMKRLFSLLAVFAMLPVGLVSAEVAHAQKSKTAAPVIRAEGHPKRIDFMALANKRADLRLSLSKLGVNAAFTQWLRSERPIAYREAVKRLAMQAKQTGPACCTTDKVCCTEGKACCKTDKDCCKAGMACCKEGANCCKAGAKCCTAVATACCQSNAACCMKEAACCKEGKACCTAEKSCCEGKAACGTESANCCVKK